jgi:hypothetical protein
VTTGRWVVHHLLGVHLDRGRIRFGGLSRVERWLVVTGMVTIGGLLILLLHPQFVPDHYFQLYGPGGIGAEDIPRAVPVLVVTGLGIFSSLLLAGAVRCPPSSRVLCALAFLMVNVQLAALFTHGPFGFGRVLVGIGFLSAVLAMVLSGVVDNGRTRSRWNRLGQLLSGLRWLAVAGAAMFYVSLISLCLDAFHGHSANVQYIGDSIEHMVDSMYAFLAALFVISALAVVRFSYGVSQVVAETSRSIGPTVAKVTVVALLVAGTVFTARRFHGEALHAYGAGPLIAVLIGLGALLLAGLTWLLRGAFATPKDEEVGIERLMRVAAAIYAMPLVLYQIGVSTSYLEVFVSPGGRPGTYSGPDLFGWIVNLSSREWFAFVPGTIIFGCLLLWGIRCVAQGRDTPSREWYAALAMLAAWTVWAVIVTWTGQFYGETLLTDEVALMVIAGIGIYLVMHFKTIDRSRLALLTAAAAMTWLVSTDGSFLSILGRDLGLGADVATAFGTALVLIGSSDFTGGDSRLFPRAARPLVWVSYLGIALLVTVWLKYTVGVSTVGGEYQLDTTNGYLYFAIPLATWLVVRGRFAPERERRPSAALAKD